MIVHWTKYDIRERSLNFGWSDFYLFGKDSSGKGIQVEKIAITERKSNDNPV
jgi:hypothetical protein